MKPQFVRHSLTYRVRHSLTYRAQKDSDTVYAFLTRVPDWKRGDRKEFRLRSVEATDKTRISVLGHAGERQVEVGFEYQEYLGFAEAMYNTTWTRTKLT